MRRNVNPRPRRRELPRGDVSRKHSAAVAAGEGDHRHRQGLGGNAKKKGVAGPRPTVGRRVG